MSLTKIEGVDKENIREVFLPRKNTLTAEDYNEIKTVVNEAVDIAVVFVSGAGVVPTLNLGQIGVNITEGKLFAGTSQGTMFIPLELI